MQSSHSLVTGSHAMNDHVRVMWEWYMIRLADGSQCQYLLATGHWSGVKCIALITLQYLHNGGLGRPVDMWEGEQVSSWDDVKTLYMDVSMIGGQNWPGKIKTQNIIILNYVISCHDVSDTHQVLYLTCYDDGGWWYPSVYDKWITWEHR